MPSVRHVLVAEPATQGRLLVADDEQMDADREPTRVEEQREREEVLSDRKTWAAISLLVCPSADVAACRPGDIAN